MGYERKQFQWFLDDSDDLRNSSAAVNAVGSQKDTPKRGRGGGAGWGLRGEHPVANYCGSTGNK